MIDKVLSSTEYKTKERDMSPTTYYKLVDITKSVSDQQVEDLRKIQEGIAKNVELSRNFNRGLLDAATKFHEESIHRMRTNRNKLGSVEAGEEDDQQYDFRSHNYILLLANVADMISQLYSQLHSFTSELHPPTVISMKSRISDTPEDFQQFQAINYEMQMNRNSVDKYVGSILSLDPIKSAPKQFVNAINDQVEKFYKYLIHTHSKEGKRIIRNAAVTNVALHIFENIDAHGEIDRDFDRERISAYTMRKAETLAQALMDSNVKSCLEDPDKLHYLVRVAIVDAASHIASLLAIFKPQLDDANRSFRPYHGIFDTGSADCIPHSELAKLDSMKFSTVAYNESISIKTNADKLGDKMRDETISKIADMLVSDTPVDFSDLVDYVISRKAELNKFYFEENSFYVCKIGEGNPFLGQAPGALYVEPAERPRGRIEDILGSGFDEIREFHGSIEASAKFHDLFVATSPSKSADKSNVLMVGPQGCGKALPVSEPVLTPDGWVPIGSIKYGDFVIGSDGKPKEVIGVYPQGRREIVRVNFTDDAKVRCDLEHLWTVKAASGNAWHTVTTIQILNGDTLDVPANQFSGTKRKWSAALYRKDGTKRLHIPIVKPIEFQWRDLSIDPYTLGAWLGDGHSNQGIICGVEEEVFEEVGKKYTQGFKNCDSHGYNGLLVQLRELNLLNNKHIPDEYLTSSVEQRLELLRGMLDTDGNAGNKTRRTTFANSNERLVDDVVSLVRSLGGIAKKGKSRLPKYKYKGEQKIGKPSWQVGIKLPDSLGAPFKMTRKVNEFESPSKYKGIRMIESIDVLGEFEDCVCIKVDADDSLFVTKDYVLTHNTEVLRAVGADKDSIGVFAQGSDFLTCWKGEAEKNPKRLFQEGLRLSKESKRHVHFLIDEIDSLLNNDRDLSGNNNLTLEFQILMDGVVSYPNLSVWGATNNVERIPMPMIRRFNKVLIVGELNMEDRVKLLQKFTSYMPIAASVKDKHWTEWSAKLDGATGDVMRKIADHIWRTKMSQFVKRSPETAEAMVNHLNANGKFSLDEFDREEFKKVLSRHVTVSGDDIEKSIESNLMNIGVRAEIRVAKETYRRAKEYLHSLKEETVNA